MKVQSTACGYMCQTLWISCTTLWLFIKTFDTFKKNNFCVVSFLTALLGQNQYVLSILGIWQVCHWIGYVH